MQAKIRDEPLECELGDVVSETPPLEFVARQEFVRVDGYSAGVHLGQELVFHATERFVKNLLDGTVVGDLAIDAVQGELSYEREILVCDLFVVEPPRTWPSESRFPETRRGKFRVSA